MRARCITGSTERNNLFSVYSPDDGRERIARRAFTSSPRCSRAAVVEVEEPKVRSVGAQAPSTKLVIASSSSFSTSSSFLSNSSLSVVFSLSARVPIALAPSLSFRLRRLPSPMTDTEDYASEVTCSHSAGFERIAFRSGFRSAPRLALPPPCPSTRPPSLLLAQVRSRFNAT